MNQKTNGLDKKRLFSLIGAGIIVVLVIVLLSIRSTQSPSFELNRQGLLEFFQENIDEIVPGEGWQVRKVRFVKEQGIYVEYENSEGRSQAFLMLVNPVHNERIDYEIIGVFNVAAEGDLELVSGVDSFAGEDQEIFRLNRETGAWEPSR